MSKTTEISNSADVIDSRDVIERIDALQDERQTLVDAVESAQEEMDDKAPDDDGGEASDERAETLKSATDELAEWDDSEEAAELKALLALQEEAEGYANGDWPHGATLIRESYFVEAMQELCEDIGDIPKEMPSYLVIDWEATARNLRMDYTEVDFDGIAYLVR